MFNTGTSVRGQERSGNLGKAFGPVLLDRK